MPSGAPCIRTGSTNAATEQGAAEALSLQLSQSDPALTVVFVSPKYDLRDLAQELQARQSGPIVGCTTAGEIGLQGYASGSISGFSMGAESFLAYPFLISPLRSFAPEQITSVLKAVHATVETASSTNPNLRAFGLLLVDGMSLMEEPLAAMLGNGLGKIPLIGGSAGDDQRFIATQLMFNGQVMEDAAIFVLVLTTLPFEVIKTQHFMASESRMVVTRATPSTRWVHEIDGRPAAEAYARWVQVAPAALDRTVFSNNPLLLRFGGDYFVRSIQRADADGSLVFACGVDQGVVLRLGQPQDLVQDLKRAFDGIRSRIGPPLLTIGYDCIFRKIEVVSRGIETPVSQVLRDAATIGFSTYGEQFGSLHINQTFTGVAIGALP